MKPISYNDTANYEFMEVLGVTGVFTSLRIDRDTLPDGFFKYSLRDGTDDFICQICNEVVVNHAGDFITKEPVDLGPEGKRNLSTDDWSFTRDNFDFESYFGKKLSIDYQIDQAEHKRTEQLNNKSHSKSIEVASELDNKDQIR